MYIALRNFKKYAKMRKKEGFKMEKKRSLKEEYKLAIKEKRLVFLVFVLLRLMVVIAIIHSFVAKTYENLFSVFSPLSCFRCLRL